MMCELLAAMIRTNYLVDYKMVGATFTNQKPKSKGIKKPKVEGKSFEKSGWNYPKTSNATPEQVEKTTESG